MNSNYNDDEREVVKLANYFIRQAKKYTDVSESGQQLALISSCQQICDVLSNHADYRSAIEEEKQYLSKIIKDNAVCPKCSSMEYLRFSEVDNSEEYKCNRYRCRKCNIAFTWNRPNNPWDMLKFVKRLKQEMEDKFNRSREMGNENSDDLSSIENLGVEVEKLSSAIDQFDARYNQMTSKDEEIQAMVKDFKKYLKIEKVKFEVLNDD
jgi:hypothetical protein